MTSPTVLRLRVVTVTGGPRPLSTQSGRYLSRSLVPPVA